MPYATFDSTVPTGRYLLSGLVPFEGIHPKAGVQDEIAKEEYDLDIILQLSRLDMPIHK